MSRKAFVHFSWDHKFPLLEFYDPAAALFYISNPQQAAMATHQGPPGPHHLHAKTVCTGNASTRDMAWGGGSLNMTAVGYTHLLHNHAVLSNQIALLGTASLAVRAGNHATQAEASAKLAHEQASLVGSAAELSVLFFWCSCCSISLCAQCLLQLGCMHTSRAVN